MNVLLLGSNGMLGQAVNKVFSEKGIHIITADKRDASFCFDFTNDEELKECLFNTHPDIVINTAAIVDLQYCEDNIEAAYKVNARLPGIVAELCRDSNTYFIQISTDHYYTYGGKTKHNEQENISLVNEYARTKYIGEILTLTHKESLVLRTNIVGFKGIDKPTFVEWAVRELEVGNKLNLFSDFYTSSIHTIDFAKVLLDVINKQPVGLMNLASSEVSSKKEFIIALSNAMFGKEPLYADASVETISGPKRAASLGLDTSKIESLVGYRMPDLRYTVDSIVREFHERKHKDEI